MESKKVLVVVSHGSKRSESNQEFKDFIRKLNQINQKQLKQIKTEESKNDSLLEKGNRIKIYQEIRGACLEFASPQLESVIEDLIEEKKAEVEILPLFIFAGYHVRQDIPERMKELKEKFEQLEYQILEHPAAADDFASNIYQQALEQSFDKN